MNISSQLIDSLRMLLQQQTGTKYDFTTAQAAGKTILRLAGIKLYQQYEKDFVMEQEIKNECISIGEHFKRVVPSNGFDICFNCGGSE